LQFKNIISTIVIVAMIFQPSTVFAVENTLKAANVTDNAENTEDVVEFDVFDNFDDENIEDVDKTNVDIGLDVPYDTGDSQNSLNFNIVTKNNKKIEFLLDNSENIIKEEIAKFQELQTKTDLDEKVLSKYKASEDFYSKILFICDDYKQITEDEKLDFQKSILYDIIDYVSKKDENIDSNAIPENENVDQSENMAEVVNEKIAFITDIILGIKIEKEAYTISLSDIESMALINEFYLELEKMVELKEIKLVMISDEIIEEPVVVDNEGGAIDPDFGIEDDIYTDIHNLVDAAATSSKDYVSNWADVTEDTTNHLVIGGNNVTLGKDSTIFREDLIYVTYKNGSKFSLGITAINRVIDFEKEKNIMTSLFKNAKENSIDNITDYMTDSSKLMVSTNGKLLISEQSDNGKTYDSFLKFYEPLNLNIEFISS